MGSAEEAGIMGSRTRIAGEMFKTVTQTGIRILEVGFGRSVLRKTTLGGNGSEDSVINKYCPEGTWKHLKRRQTEDVLGLSPGAHHP